MRRLADAERIREFMRAVGAEARQQSRLYFTGGATAVLSGWRQSTIDIDILVVPEQDRILRLLPQLKNALQINIELACPTDFIPELPGWEGRSRFIHQEGKLSFHDYDYYAQALAKIERGHAQDAGDVREMLQRKLIDPAELMRLFEQIEPSLYRYPALDPTSFRRAVQRVVHDAEAAP